MHSSQLAQQAAMAYTAGQAKEAERVAEHIQRVEARWFACAADAEAAIADYEGRGQGRRGRKPPLALSCPSTIGWKRSVFPRNGTQRGRPLKAEVLRLRSTIAWLYTQRHWSLEGAHEVDGPGDHGTARGVCTDAELLQAYQEQHITVEPGFRWIKNPATISPVWLEKPERIAALAMLSPSWDYWCMR